MSSLIRDLYPLLNPFLVLDFKNIMKQNLGKKIHFKYKSEMGQHLNKLKHSIILLLSKNIIKIIQRIEDSVFGITSLLKHCQNLKVQLKFQEKVSLILITLVGIYWVKHFHHNCHFLFNYQQREINHSEQNKEVIKTMKKILFLSVKQ